MSSELSSDVGTPGLKAALRTLLKGLHYSGAFFPSLGPPSQCLRLCEKRFPGISPNGKITLVFWWWCWFLFCFILLSSFSQKMHLVGWGCGSVSRAPVQTVQGSGFSLSTA